ncbi:MAG: RNA polymerase sigma factor [Alphaproteobacteria bacterium]|nr:MAG: RNA polymerase sigma factor [Alphaproteobacteria bacterium]
MPRTNISEDATDDALLSLTAQGNREAFRLLVRRHQTMVTRFACRLLNGDRSAAEDIGQEAFLRLFRAAKSYAARGEMCAFLLVTTRNLCRDHLRRERPTEEWEILLAYADPSPTGEGIALLQERSETVRKAIAALSEEQRTVLILSHYEGVPYAKIAAIVGCPAGTVASRKHHALAALRRSLQSYLDEN